MQAIKSPLFTPAQANKTLPLVRQIVRDILERGRALREATDGYEKSHLARELNDLTRELAQIGCVYQDWSFELGLVDFPTEIDGASVVLCWRSDEPSVTHYHPLDEGYAGRRAIPAHLLAEGPREE